MRDVVQADRPIEVGATAGYARFFAARRFLTRGSQRSDGDSALAHAFSSAGISCCVSWRASSQDICSIANARRIGTDRSSQCHRNSGKRPGRLDHCPDIRDRHRVHPTVSRFVRKKPQLPDSAVPAAVHRSLGRRFCSWRGSCCSEAICAPSSRNHQEVFAAAPRWR